MKRALVVGGGGLTGAYGAGVVATLCRKLGSDYFDTVIASSVGVFAATFFVANQPSTIENTWRNLIDGRKLVNLFNPLFGREILDLEYLVEIFRNKKSNLKVERVFASNIRLIYVLTQYPTGVVAYRMPTREDMFNLMRASSALPLVHRPVLIDGRRYIDGGLSDSLPIRKALEENCDEVIAVYNKPRGYENKQSGPLWRVMPYFLPSSISKLVRARRERTAEVERSIDNSPLIRVIRPEIRLPLRSHLDTDKSRLNAVIDQGIADASTFVELQLTSRRS